MFDNLGFEFSCREFLVVGINDYSKSSHLILSCDYYHRNGYIFFNDVSEIIPSNIDGIIGKTVAYIYHEDDDLYIVNFGDEISEIKIRAKKVLIQGPYDAM